MLRAFTLLFINHINLINLINFINPISHHPIKKK